MNAAGSISSAASASPGKLALELVARGLTAAIFFYAAYGKLDDPDGLAQAIENYRVLPAGWAAPLSVVMPTLELTLAAAVLTGALGRGASVLVTGLLLVFAAAMVQALVRDIDLRCGCFGDGSDEVSGWTVARNVTLAAVSAVPIWTGITPWRRILRPVLNLVSRPPA